MDESLVNCRQLVSRAKQRVQKGKSRFEADQERGQSFLMAFGEATQTGDMDALLSLFHKDIVLYSDGGGKVVAALRPVFGADRVARFLLGLAKKAPEGVTMHPTEVNGLPGVLTRHQGRVDFVMSIEMAEGVAIGIRIVRNPEKLKAFNESIS